MNEQNEYQQRMNLAMHQYERAHIFALCDEIYEYRRTVQTLLDNGRPIFEQAVGERFQKLFDKRRELWHKLHTIDKIIDILYKHTY